MAQSNISLLPNRAMTRLRVQAQTCAATGILVARMNEIEPQHRAPCARRLAELLDTFQSSFLSVDGVSEHLTKLAELPHDRRLDRIADHLLQLRDVAQMTHLPEVPSHDDPEAVQSFTQFAATLLSYVLFLQTASVLSRRLAS